MMPLSDEEYRKAWRGAFELGHHGHGAIKPDENGVYFCIKCGAKPLKVSQLHDPCPKWFLIVDVVRGEVAPGQSGMDGATQMGAA